MYHRISVALKFFLIPPWAEQLAKRQFQFAAKVAAGQSWVSKAGHWTITDRWHSNLYRLANVDVHLSNGMANCQTLQDIISHCIMNGLRRLNCHHGKMRGSTSFHIFPISLWDRSRGVSVWLGRAQSKQKSLAGTYRIGRPHFHWESKLQSYCKYKSLGRWIDAAMSCNLWNQHCISFIEFCCT